MLITWRGSENSHENLNKALRNVPSSEGYKEPRVFNLIKGRLGGDQILAHKISTGNAKQTAEDFHLSELQHDPTAGT